MDTAISLNYPTIFSIGPITISNTVLGSYLTSAIIIAIIFFALRNIKIVPTKIQLVFEIIITTFYEFCKSAYQSEEKSKRYVSLYVTLFLFLLVANQFSILPIISNIIIQSGQSNIPLFKISTADFSQTLTLGFMIVILAHLIAFATSPLQHLNNYIKIKKFLTIKKPSDLANVLLEQFIGIMDIIGELSKILSISARLFGNIFAGEVMSTVITSLVAYIIPAPFIFLSVFSGLVQAFVFAILSIQFMSGVINSVNPAPKTQEKFSESNIL